jgi:hypothetical protein
MSNAGQNVNWGNTALISDTLATDIAPAVTEIVNSDVDFGIF